MKILKESFDNDELQQLRKNLPLSSWKRQVYVLITERLNNSVLDRMMSYINRIVPENASSEEKKMTILRAMSDYLDSVL